MNNDAFYFYLVAAVALVIVAIFWRVRSRRTAAEEPDAKRYDKWLRDVVAAGTHNPQGKPLCRICGDKDDPDTVATHWGFKAARNDGFTAWARTRLGAPARYKVARDKRDDKDKDYCAQHAPIAQQVFRSHVLHFEQERRDAVVNEEVELARYERTGLDQAVRARVEAHDKEMKRGEARPPAKVVSLR